MYPVAFKKKVCRKRQTYVNLTLKLKAMKTNLPHVISTLFNVQFYERFQHFLIIH